jgi:Flp pilus assembly protein TadG
MKQAKLTERGQALIMIAFAIVGLVGFTALAIDGGAVFSDRRHSQNASDTSVTAAALERVPRSRLESGRIRSRHQ